jgi:hypothetical protein
LSGGKRFETRENGGGEMLNELQNIRPVDNTIAIPDGRYEGSWSGYHVRFRVHDREYEGESEVGIRGMNEPCIVTKKGKTYGVQVKLVDG